MKVAHVTATFPPYLAGTGNVAYHNARLLRDRGHDVTVFTARDERAQLPTPDIGVERLPPVWRIGNAPFTPSLVSRLRGFDLIHLHYPYIFGGELALLAARLFGIPLVVTVHNRLEDRRPLRRLLFGLYNRSVERMILAGSTRLFAVRREHFSTAYPVSRLHPRVRELVNGIDTTLFCPGNREEARRELGIPGDKRVVLFVGALDSAHTFKNADGLIRAFAASTVPEAHLLIAGDGDLKPRLESLADRLGLTANVSFLGRRSQEQLPGIYRSADVTVLPSTSVESFGLVLLESIACLTPVIASELPGVAEIVTETGGGLLVKPGDEGELARALNHILGNPPGCEQMNEARNRVRQSFDWEVVGDTLIDYYQEMLS